MFGAVFGGALFTLYAPGAAALLRMRRTLIAATLGALLVAGVMLAVQTALMSGTPGDAADPELLEAVLTGTGAGRALAARGALISAALAALVVLPFRSRLTLGFVTALSGGALASMAWSGHGAAGGGVVHLTVVVLHLLAAGAWIGALVPFGRFALRARGSLSEGEAAHMADALERFAGVGSVIVAVLILTGVLNTWFLARPDVVGVLFSELWGRLLLLKLVLFGGMLAIAALNRFSLTPAVRRGVTDEEISRVAFRRLRSSVVVETLLAFGVLALVAWLGTLSPQGDMMM